MTKTEIAIISLVLLLCGTMLVNVLVIMPNLPEIKPENSIQSQYLGHGINKVIVEKHEYLGYYSKYLIHSESCPCRSENQ